MHTDILEPLVKRHDFPVLLRELTAIWEQENSRRQQFRDELCDDTKAEFIAGEIIIHSPARARHLIATKNLLKLVDTYVLANNLGQVFSEKALVCLTRNDFEPDIAFFNQQKSQHFTLDQMKFPAPDFVVEVLSDSTEARDRGIKLLDYAEHYVAEYWIIDADEDTVEQYLLSPPANRYSLHAKIREGRIKSQILAGFEIPLEAIFDEQAQMAELQRMLSPKA